VIGADDGVIWLDGVRGAGKTSAAAAARSGGSAGRGEQINIWTRLIHMVYWSLMK